MNSVFLALGSNLGDREEYLRSGLRGLAARGIDIVRVAPVYSTEPLVVVEQPWFLNTVIEARTQLAPSELLNACLDVERENHRVRTEGLKGPRTLDIDIIFYDARIIREPGLTIPHPSFAGRRFVLAPLADIAPDFRDPVSGKTIRELLDACPDTSNISKQLTNPLL
jgi:2-amino-4-hydroxy-6-hydroxymethyldihydropteridine diphosphokinase